MHRVQDPRRSFLPERVPADGVHGLLHRVNRELVDGRKCEGTYERVFAVATSFVLKGKGWAKDGY